MSLNVTLLRHLKSALSDRRVWVAAIVALVVGTYPLYMGALGGHLVTSKATAKLGVPVVARTVRAGWGGLRMWGVSVGKAETPLVTAERVDIPMAALWGKGSVVVDHPVFHVQRGGSQDNVSGPLSRLRGGGQGSVSSSRGPGRLPAVSLNKGSLWFADQLRGVVLEVASFDLWWDTGNRFSVEAHQMSGSVRWRGNEGDPSFGAAFVGIEGPLQGTRPNAWPEVTLRDGYLRALPTLPLTGIAGAIRPTASHQLDQQGWGSFDLFFSGSYGGAKRSLWTATGRLNPALNRSSVDGTLSLRVERFSLDKIAEVLPASVLEPENTEIDAALDVKLGGRKVSVAGKLDVSDLSLVHEKLASDPVKDVSLGMRVDASFDIDKRRIDVDELEGRIGNLLVHLDGALELAPGIYHFKNGREIYYLPKLDLHLRVPRVSCSKLLSSIPGPIVPRLQGFVLQGSFEADIRSKVDLSNLESLELGGKVGIDGCQVVKAPAEVTALAGEQSLVQMVEVPPLPSGIASSNGMPEILTFVVGPDNPDFVPYNKISPHLINAIMTTEDSGFFRHRGWVSPTFKSALKRNIENGGFRLGASSITMQMVKNVLLSQEKTLSRKLQELFLVWYVEQIMPKERILELYFNAIEFGPRLYGIGAAARHYFGKSASDITPLEAAFFSSILPSPKRRYIHYCHGALASSWEKYLHRILSRMLERGRLTEEEFVAANNSPLTFDLSERTMTEKQCLDWVRRITARPEPEPEADADAP